jgi:asparagine synthase (glutamine-hydrolysing)
MCGICGIVRSDSSDDIDTAALSRMRDVMTYRGPDDAGSYVVPGAGLAIRRLSIIDILGGHQPMCNEDRTLWIVFNGEIYNYLELRQQHLSHGHRFASHSDTEVILHLFEQYGADCVKYLNGMFAFAIWNTETQELFLARDRVGVKSLYYTIAGDTLLFASEIKSLLQYDGVRAEPDLEAMDEFLSYGYTQTPRTLFKGIFRLPEGHVARWKRGAFTVKRYWDVSFSSGPYESEEACKEQLLELLKDSVRFRLRSDVPVGVLLSGGIDSSAVTGLLSQSVNRVQTFSIGFAEGAGYNELAYARQIAKHFRTDHHETILSPPTFLDFIPRFIYHMDEPVADGASIPLYFVSALAANHVKVVLSGEGADELFGGYSIYLYMSLLEKYRRVPAAARQVVDRVLGTLPVFGSKFRKYTPLAGLPLSDRYTGPRMYDRTEHTELYADAVDDALRGRNTRQAHQALWSRAEPSWDHLSRMLYVDMSSWLPNDLLIKADRMTMAKSIELRVPFLDYRLIEFVASVPSRLKIRGSETKYLLKRAMESVLPRDIIYRSKLGFPTPLASVFREAAGAYVNDILLSPRALKRGYFRRDAVQRLVTEHEKRVTDHHEMLWRLIVLEEWHRCFVDRSATAAAPFVSQGRASSSEIGMAAAS